MSVLRWTVPLSNGRPLVIEADETATDAVLDELQAAGMLAPKWIDAAMCRSEAVRRPALPGEPAFTLMARDTQAPGLLMMWAAEREAGIAEGRFPESDRTTVAEVRELASKMLAWRQQNDGAWRQQNPDLFETPDPAASVLTAGEHAEQRADRALGLYGPDNPPRLFGDDFAITLRGAAQ